MTSDTDSLSESHDIHADVGCYVVDALEPVDRDVFEAHLPGCDSCTRQVIEFTETVAELGLLMPAVPPPSLRSSILDTIRTVRPLPPHVDETNPMDHPATGTHAGAGNENLGGLNEPPTDEVAARRARSNSRRPRILVLVAAAAVAILAFGTLFVNLNQQHQADIAAQAAT